MRAASGELLRRINQPSRHFELVTANALWGDQSQPFQPEFIRDLGRSYQAAIRTMSFRRAPEAARGEINAWVSGQTRNRIRDLLPAGAVTSSTRLVLVNAIAFRGLWESAFPRNQTRPADFRIEGHPSIRVPTMHQRDMAVRTVRARSFEAIAIPYRGGSLAMVVLLPHEAGWAAFHEELAEVGLDRLLAGLAPDTIHLALPRFRLDSDVDLGTHLAALGMPTAFQEGAADFSGMVAPETSAGLFISRVVQKALLEVDEVGTVAATAVTMTESFGTPSAPRTVRVDRPFLLLIRGRATGVVLFLGRVADPR